MIVNFIFNLAILNVTFDQNDYDICTIISPKIDLNNDVSFAAIYGCKSQITDRRGKIPSNRLLFNQIVRILNPSVF